MSKFKTEKRIKAVCLIMLLLITCIPNVVTAAKLDKDEIVLVKSDKEYELDFGDKDQKAVQNFYVGNSYIYTTQRYKYNDAQDYNYVKITKFNIVNKKPQKAINPNGTPEEMWIKYAGHGQTLEVYEHKGKVYILTSLWANKNYDEQWSLEIGRVEFVSNTKETAVLANELKRFFGIEYANPKRKNFGVMQRTDAAVSQDNSTILIWKRNEDEENEFSAYNFKKFNEILDGTTEYGKYTRFNFKNIPANKSWLKFSFNDVNGGDSIPKSIQGLEVSDEGDNGKHSIYIVSGNEGKKDSPNRIYRFNSDGKRKNKKIINSKENKVFNKPMEIEGIHVAPGNKLRFLLVESDYLNGIKHKNANKSKQYIFSVNKRYLK
ncbi:MAG: class III bacteriocin [Eubacterium sp.]|nr:class III bacteriocin [Eubacterium sp.]